MFCINNSAGQGADDFKGKDSVEKNQDDVTGNDAFFVVVVVVKIYTSLNSLGNTS